MTDENLYFVETDSGEPVGIVDAGMITNEGTNLAFRMAALSDNADMMTELLHQTLHRVGVENFGPICAKALRVLAEDVLAPAFDIALKTTGHDFWLALAQIAAGKEPTA